MSKLEDYTTLSKKEFWNLIDKEGNVAKETFARLWKELDERHLTQEEAVECLNALFIDSHRRIKEHSSVLASEYPTRQRSPNRLEKQEDCWWVDHFTAGISAWSTLNWFSSAKRKKKNGKMGYAGASTHFIIGYHGAPFYIIPLMHASWNEPRRNRDSISVEMVNAGRLHKDKEGNWCYWARKLPMELVQELPPVLLDKPYRGCKVMQPFTTDQIVNNIKLKRLVIAALQSKLDPSRMSQHSDWREGKSDMGKLWPYEDCNAAAFGPEPIPELSFIQAEEYVQLLEDKGTIWDETHGWDTHDEQDNPEYGEETPTHDDDPDDATEVLYNVKDIQERLVTKGYIIAVDGRFGPQTRTAIKKFQGDWNKKNDKDKLKVDGLPGPLTCSRLFK